MELFTSLLVLVAGHLSGAYMFYFFHRYIFHGKLGKLPVLKRWKAIHTQHHRTPEDPGSFFFPWWANIIIWSFAGSLFYLSPVFSLGMFSFFATYTYRHRSAHQGSETPSALHHMSHHRKNPLSNFSGTYPFIDRVFGTYDPVPVRVRKK